MSLAIENFGKLLVLSFRGRIFLNNNNKTISGNEELAEISNRHFSKLVENLDIDKNLSSNIASSDITGPVFNAIKKYEYYASIKK